MRKCRRSQTTQSLLQEGPSRYGIESDPALVYYEKEVPAVFEGDLDVTDSGIFLLLSKHYDFTNFSVIDWLMEHRTADSIEEVTEEMLVAVSLKYQRV